MKVLRRAGQVTEVVAQRGRESAVRMRIYPVEQRKRDPATEVGMKNPCFTPIKFSIHPDNADVIGVLFFLYGRATKQNYAARVPNLAESSKACGLVTTHKTSQQ